MKTAKIPITKIIIIFIILASVFSVRFEMLLKSEHPTGLDGYYYALQAKSLVETGSLENPDLECGYYLCGAMSYLCGNPILGVKIWSALAFTLFCLSVFFLMKVLLCEKESCFFWSLISLLLVAATFFSTSFTINYINNITGLMFLLFYCGTLILLFRKKDSKVKFFIALFITPVLLLLAAISHKVSAMYALIFTVVFIFNHFFKRNKKILPYIVPSILILAVIGILLLMNQFPRFKNTFAFSSFPFMHEGFIAYKGTLGLFCAVEVSLYMILGWIVSIVFCFVKKRCGIQMILTFILLFPFWNLDSDMGYRMICNGTLLSIPLVIYQLSILKTSEQSERHSENNTRHSENNTRHSELVSESHHPIIKTVLVLFLFTLQFFISFGYSKKNDPRFSYYKQIIENIELDSDTLLIAHLGLNHVYTYYKDLKDCLNWLPDYDIPEDKVWRLAYGADYERISGFYSENTAFDLEKELIPVNSSYILLKEKLWQDYLKKEEPEIAETFNNWFNPYEVRPSYVRNSFSK